MQKYNANHAKQFRGIRIVFVVLVLCLPFIVSAYTFLEPLPGLGEKVETDVLAQYLSWLFRFALAAAAFLAVLQITIGGIQMIFGGASETARTNAKSRIWDAIWGLVLALGSFLILSTISPQFTDMKLTIPPVTVEVAKGPTGEAYEGGCCASPGITKTECIYVKSSDECKGKGVFHHLVKCDEIGGCPKSPEIALTKQECEKKEGYYWSGTAAHGDCVKGTVETLECKGKGDFSNKAIKCETGKGLEAKGVCTYYYTGAPDCNTQQIGSQYDI